MKEGWCDYFAPQLYWPIDQKAQSFPVLYEFWRQESTHGVPVWPGLFTSRTGDMNRPFPPKEILRQIEVVRSPGAGTGHIHFSMKALMQNREGLANELQTTLYASPALVPSDPIATGDPPSAPIVDRAEPGSDTLRIRPGDAKSLKAFAIWNWDGSQWSFTVIPSSQSHYNPPAASRRVVITAVDRHGRESTRTPFVW